MVDERWFTRKQAAEYLRCSVSLLNKLAVNEPKTLPYLRLGRTTHYKQTDLDKYLNGHMQGAR